MSYKKDEKELMKLYIEYAEKHGGMSIQEMFAIREAYFSIKLEKGGE